MNNNNGRSLTGVTSGSGSVGNVTATLSNMNISNVNISNVAAANVETINVNSIPNATIREFNINELIYTTISSINLGQIIAGTTQAVMNTVQINTPLGVINVFDSNAGNLSTLSSIVSYGLSTVSRQPSPGISSLSTLLSYGLSTLSRQPAPGVSSLSTIVSYGLSSTQYISSNTLNHTFIRSSIGGADINDGTSRPGLDTFTDALAKIDTVFERLISKPPAPVLWEEEVGLNYMRLKFSNAPQYFFNGFLAPDIIFTEYSLSYFGDQRPTYNSYTQSNLFTIRTPVRTHNQGLFFLEGIDSNIVATTFSLSVTAIDENNSYDSDISNGQFLNSYNLNRFYDNYGTEGISTFNPYIFKMRWINNAIYPDTDNYFTQIINFEENPIFSDPPDLS
jgi:hypothetical protein